MQAIVLDQGQYTLRECEMPVAGAGEVLIKVMYAGLNRADLFQKQGRYPLPQHSPAIPGMEISGEVIQADKNVGLQSGDKVCALLREGAFAEYVVAPASLVFPVPDTLSLEEASALPEACFTSWISLVWQARIQPSETILIHGGASGIGSIAIQVAVLLGARVFATAGTKEKCLMCEKLGAEKAIYYREEDYVKVIKEKTNNKGVDVILDMVGGDYFERNLESLAHGGRLSIIAFLRGPKVVVNLSPILLKHLSVMGSTLRSRPQPEQEQIAKELRENLWKAVEKGKLKPVIDRIFPLQEAEKALERMDQGLNVGKILFKI